MAGKKITELPELGTTPAADDWLVVVDVSDTSESAEGTTKKVLKSDAVTFTLPYKSIVCIINQVGTDDPAAIILQNDFTSGLIFKRNTTGKFNIQKGTSDVVFDPTNTVVFGTSINSLYSDCFIVAGVDGTDDVFIYNYGNGGGLQDGYTMQIEIRVYP
jgi:hypothetical protein